MGGEAREGGIQLPKVLKPGTEIYVNRSGAAHFVWSDEPMTVQLTGIGPWAIHPLHQGEAATN